MGSGRPTILGAQSQSGGLTSSPLLQMPPCQGNARKGAGSLEDVLGAKPLRLMRSWK